MNMIRFINILLLKKVWNFYMFMFIINNLNYTIFHFKYLNNLTINKDIHLK